MKYNVTRSTTIQADLAKVEGLIADFKEWKTWSPWNIAEPDVPIRVEGTPGEPGHVMKWDGKIIGSGINTLKSNENGVLRYDLEFLKPWKSKADVALKLEKEGDGTKVTWTMDSAMPFFLFFMKDMMKALIGMDYDRGLRMLKELAEKGEIKAETVNKGVHDYKGFGYVGLKRTTTMEGMKEQMPKDFEKIIAEIVEKHGIKPAHWIGLYPKFHAKTNSMTYIAAISDEALEGVELGDEYVRGTIEDGPVFEVEHAGSFDFIGNAWSMGMMHVRAKKLKQRGSPFEYYWNDPRNTPENDLKTSVYFQVKSK